MNSMIDVQGLTKRFGALTAVDNVSFEVRQGEIFGFLGPNGAGKTTTVRMLTTLLASDAGRIRIGGYDLPQQARSVRRLLGIVPEESNVYPELSCWDNLLFAAQLHRVPRGERERRAYDLLDTFGLQDKRRVRAQRLSKGLRRRLTIALALLHRPALLFLDEPTSGLDVQSARTIKEVVRRLHANGTTVFLTTHQIEEANQLCDRVAIIHLGRLAAVDTPEQLKRTFQTVQSVEVCLESCGAAERAALTSLPGVTEAVKEGDKVRLYTPDPSALLPEIVACAQVTGRRVVTLNTLGPSLEDVFLHLTGQPVGAREEGSGRAA